MLQRQGAHGAGSWSIPGGWMEFGESFEDTAHREIAEEVGIKISNLRFGAVTNNVFKDEKVHSITIWMLSDYKSGEPQILEPDKCKNIGWYDFESLPRPLFLPWKDLLKSRFIIDIKNALEDNRASKHL